MTTRLGAPPRIEIAARQSNEWAAEAGREDNADLGFTAGEMRAVVRRQLTGSIVVGLAIAVVAGLTALRPSHPETSLTSIHRFPVAEQPIIIRAERHIASTKQYGNGDLQPSRERP
jgi:hypothetical protein